MSFTVLSCAVFVLTQVCYCVPPRYIHQHWPPYPLPSPHRQLPHYYERTPFLHPEVFPQSFSFGVAEGAVTHEGAWNEDGKGENIWDHFAHYSPEAISDGSNADIAADSYHHLKDDVEILNNLTVRHFMFTISWSRLIPQGCGDVNHKAVHYYQRLIKLLKENQIEPVVSLYNLDIPQALEEQGGFLNDKFPFWFSEYARTAFDIFGSSVKYWITFQYPVLVCVNGYGVGDFAPGISDNPGFNEYICGHNLLKAHADAYHLYDECFRPTQKGKISLTITAPWFEPVSDCQADIDASERRMQFEIGWWAHPIYLGDYPPVMIERIGRLSELQGLEESRLPRFTRKEVDWIKDTHDFFAINTFDSYHISDIQNEECLSPSYASDTGTEASQIKSTDAFGIRNVIVWIKNHYLNPAIFILSNGYGTSDNTLDDYDRIDYIKSALTNVRAAMINDDARVYGYTYFSYIDGFLFKFGYTVKRGLYRVDFDCPDRTRTARRSAEYFQHVCKYGCINEVCPARYTY